MAKFKINNLLNFYNLNQKDLSAGTGINKNTINRYCNNTFDKITKEHLDLIVSFFQCSLEDIMEVKSDIEIQYPSEMVKNMIENYKVMQKLSQEEIESIVTDTSDKKINSYIENKPKIITTKTIMKNAKEFEKNNGYNPIMNDEKIYELEQMQERLDKEYDISENLEKVVKFILNNCDLNNLKSKIKTELNALKAVNNTIPFIFRFMLSFHSLYYIVMKQMYNKQLIDFLQHMKRVYVNNTGSLIIDDDNLNDLLKESNELLKLYELEKD